MGVMQYVIGKIAWLMQKCLDTTAAEVGIACRSTLSNSLFQSMNAAANIFVGMVEAPLMIMPLVPKMTTSELHAVLVGGFATMAGEIFKIKISINFLNFVRIGIGNIYCIWCSS